MISILGRVRGGGWFLSVGIGLCAPLAWASSTTGVVHTVKTRTICKTKGTVPKV